MSLKQQIRQEFDETFESVKDFGTLCYLVPLPTKVTKGPMRLHWVANKSLYGMSCVFVASASLKGREKKAHETKKIVALGGKAAATRTMPYKMLMGLKKKGVVREQRNQELVCDNAVAVAVIFDVHRLTQMALVLCG